MAHGAPDLRLEQLRVVAEVTHQRVPEDHDPVVEVVAGRPCRPGRARTRAGVPAAVGDDDRDVLERAVELQRQLVERRADERLEVLLVVDRHRLVVVVVIVVSSSAVAPQPLLARVARRGRTSRSNSSSDSGSRQPAETNHRSHDGADDQHRAGREHRDPLKQPHRGRVAEPGQDR